MHKANPLNHTLKNYDAFRMMLYTLEEVYAFEDARSSNVLGEIFIAA